MLCANAVNMYHAQETTLFLHCHYQNEEAVVTLVTV